MYYRQILLLVIIHGMEIDSSQILFIICLNAIVSWLVKREMLNQPHLLALATTTKDHWTGVVENLATNK